MDTSLARTVLLERFHQEIPLQMQKRLFLMASVGGPFLQRILGMEDTHVIYENRSGTPLSSLSPMSERLAIRFLKRLARALLPLHAQDKVHGLLCAQNVLLDTRGHPTLLVCGTNHQLQTQSCQDEVNDVLTLMKKAVGKAEAPSFCHAVLQKKLSMPLQDADDLFAYADTLERLFLQKKQGL